MPQRSSRGAGSRRATWSRPDRRSEDPTPTAIGLLARRAHSRSELRTKLIRRGYSAEAIDSSLASLVELGYLDDRSFAQSLVRRRGALRGPLALSAELAAKGVDRAQADAALAEFDPEAQLASATRLAGQLHARRPVAGYQEMLNGVGAKLLRRGFPATIVRAACRSVLEGAPLLADD